MSNKKRISRFAKDKNRSLEIESLKFQNCLQRMQLMMMKISIADIASRKILKSYPSGGFIGEVGDEIILGGKKNLKDYSIQVKNREMKFVGEGSPEILSTFNGIKNDDFTSTVFGEKFEKYKNSWMEEFNNNPNNKKPFLKYLIDRFNLEVPFPDQYTRN